MITLKHCPGFEAYKHLKSFSCKCTGCGKKWEIFSDEFDRKHTCKNCGKKLDFQECKIEAES